MKHTILIHSIAALLVAVPFSSAEDKKAEEKNEAQKIEKAEKSEKKSSSSSVVAADGTATITIDINGKKETRTFKLGDGKNNVLNFGKEGDGAKAGGAAGFGGKGFVKPGQGKREKGPWLGIAMEPVPEVARAQLPIEPGEGVAINHVAPDGPAAKAGLQPNDILLRFDEQILVEPSQLRKLIAMKQPGDSVKLTYLRKGERKNATVTLIEHEIEQGEGGAMQWFGNHPGVFNLPVPAPGMGKAFEQQLQQFKEKRPELEKHLEGMQDKLRQLKEKHPGVVVEKQEWLSGSPEQMLKGQIEKLQRVLDESKLPKEQVENLRKQIDHARREASEAMERAKRETEGAVKNAQRALEEASRAFNETRKQSEKEKKGDQPKKPGEPL
ncbi:MAG: PDZ domain-containing protein [Chthoniobacteraceae bacterium]